MTTDTFTVHARSDRPPAINGVHARWNGADVIVRVGTHPSGGQFPAITYELRFRLTGEHFILRTVWAWHIDADKSWAETVTYDLVPGPVLDLARTAGMSGKKTWDKMTSPEKIEDLRSDVVRLFDVLNVATGDIRRCWNLAQQNQSKLTEVAKAVEELKGRFPTGP